MDKKKEWHRQYSAKHYRQNRVKYMLRDARLRATKAGVAFEITAADVEIPTVCPVLGVELVLDATQGGSPYSPTLDRIAPEQGYVPGNVVVISKRANNIKSNATSDEVRRVANWMKEKGL